MISTIKIVSSDPLTFSKPLINLKQTTFSFHFIFDLFILAFSSFFCIE